MLELVREPISNRALSLTDILEFEIDANGASVDLQPVFSVILIGIDGTTGGGAADGQTITLFDALFTTDSNTPFTATTWDASGTPEQSANNLANMLRANFLFQEYDIRVNFSSSGNVWSVIANATEAKTFSNFIFNDAGFTPGFAEFISANGSPAQLNNFRIYYDIYEGIDDATTTKLGDTRVAFVPYNSFDGKQNCIINLRKQLSNIFQLHNFLAEPAQRVRRETGLKRRFYIRYGGVNFDQACNQSFVAGGQSSVFNIVYTALQRNRFANFLEYTIEGNPLGSVKWLTERSNIQKIGPDTYETINCYIPQRDRFQNFSAVFSFYNENDDLLALFTDSLDENEVYQIAIGTANLQPFIPSGTTYYTVEIVAQELINGSPTAFKRFHKLQRRDIDKESCKKIELYFIEDLNSYRTVHLVKQTSFSIAGQSRNTELPIFSQSVNGFYTASDYINRGGETSRFTEASEVIRLETERILPKDASLYAQLVRSPIHLIRQTTVDGQTVIRKVVLTRSNQVIQQNSEAIKLNLEFRFNESLNLLK